MFEQFAFMCYSVPDVPGSKTLWVGSGSVNIRTEAAPGIPTEIASWTESHLYRNVNGDHFNQIMSPVTGSTMPAQGPHFRSAEISVNEFFAPDENLTAIARIESLSFSDPNGAVFAVPVGNTEIDVVLEPNANPPVTCP